MIQRKQTLFLLELLFLGIALLFVPCNTVTQNNLSSPVSMLPVGNEMVSTTWHYVLMIINFFSIVISSICIFLYKKRKFQLQLCHLLMALYSIFSALIAIFPLVQSSNGAQTNNTYFGLAIGIFEILAAFLAARFIKKDIELLKSADRIR